MSNPSPTDAYADTSLKTKKLTHHTTTMNVPGSAGTVFILSAFSEEGFGDTAPRTVRGCTETTHAHITGGVRSE